MSKGVLFFCLFFLTARSKKCLLVQVVNRYIDQGVAELVPGVLFDKLIFGKSREKQGTNRLSAGAGGQQVH